VRAAILLTALGAVLALAGPAAAAPSWLDPVTVDNSADPAEGDIAVAPDGTALAVTQVTIGGADHIRARLRRPGGAFGPAVELATANGDFPRVAVDQHGNFTAAWTVGADLKAARLAAGAASFEATETVGMVDPVNPQPVLAVGGNGTAVLAVREGGTVHAALRTDTGANGTFGPLSGALSGTLQIGDELDAAMDDAGRAVIVWSRDDLAGVTRVERSERTTGGFGGAQLVSSEAIGDRSTGPKVAMAPNGRAIIMWTLDTNADQPRVWYRERNPDGSYDPAAPASRDIDTANNPELGIAGDGTAIAVWRVDVATVFLPQAAVRPPGGSFQILQPNLSSAPTGRLELSVNRAGFTTVAFSGSMSETITARRRAPGGAFGTSETVASGTQGGATPSIAVNVQGLGTDDQSNATLIYQRDVTGGGQDSHSLLTASFDAVAPAFSAIAVPGAGNPNAAIGMAATASDRLSSPGISWSFGDGTTATGAAVSHAYSKIGAFTVTVSATDSAGNTTTQSRPVVITSPAGTPRIRSKINVLWLVQGKKTWLQRMKVTRAFKGMKAELRCKGKRCPFKRFSSRKVRKHSITLFKKASVNKTISTRKRSFHFGQRLEVRLTAKGHIGKVVRYRLRKGDIPVPSKALCLLPGTKKPRKTCKST
jgi:hypothetical protein